ncbi:FlgB family protein [Roseobacter ponti]|uniref:FlgB family protein n=1 Tax=Roseobacter ponti TaxID=1891787 RepID=A0A858T174_9RHOB|nr:FlgB family protein [Roseobacter ponti]QJF52986.1 FlgB family protein [Roseobacter ponti]
MFEKLDVFRMAHAMAVHAGHSQAVAAQNVANSDTPGFKARRVIPFSETYQDGPVPGGHAGQLSTRTRHLNGAAAGSMPEPVLDKSGPAAPNGNTVSLENEMLKSLDAKRQHDRALAIYKSSMTILRATLSRS